MRTYTGSTSNDDRAKKGPNAGKIMVNLKENIRDPAEIAKLNARSIARGEEPRYDLNEAWRNIYYEKCATDEEVFDYVFGESMERYNSAQKRSDRKTSMEKEMQKFKSGKVPQDMIHCMIVEVGNHDNHPEEEECVEILQEYLEKFREKFPNMRIVNCAIHLDEFKKGGPHLQIYYVPVKTKERHEEMENPKKWNGMDVQLSMSGALEQMGYSNEAKIWVEKKDENGDVVLGEDGEPVMVQTHDYKNGAMSQFQKDFNGLLDAICLEHDIRIDHYMSGKKVEHSDTYDFYSGKINNNVKQALRYSEQVEKRLSELIA
ncbi:MAG: plasmid recombination protein [Acetatifactor sp.]|nr:plasmid recombination protein [Acetatifactor sp.]